MNTKEILNLRAADLSKILGFPIKYYAGSNIYGRPHCFGPDEPCGEFNQHRVGIASGTAAGLLDAVDAWLAGYEKGKRTR